MPVHHRAKCIKSTLRVASSPTKPRTYPIHSVTACCINDPFAGMNLITEDKAIHFNRSKIKTSVIYLTKKMPSIQWQHKNASPWKQVKFSVNAPKGGAFSL